jgi:hypothetical protein
MDKDKSELESPTKVVNIEENENVEIGDDDSSSSSDDEEDAFVKE